MLGCTHTTSAIRRLARPCHLAGISVPRRPHVIRMVVGSVCRACSDPGPVLGVYLPRQCGDGLLDGASRLVPRLMEECREDNRDERRKCEHGAGRVRVFPLPPCQFDYERVRQRAGTSGSRRKEAIDVSPSFALGHLVLGMAQLFHGTSPKTVPPLIRESFVSLLGA